MRPAPRMSEKDVSALFALGAFFIGALRLLFIALVVLGVIWTGREVAPGHLFDIHNFCQGAWVLTVGLILVHFTEEWG